jgi:hypothetical protein
MRVEVGIVIVVVEVVVLVWMIVQLEGRPLFWGDAGLHDGISCPARSSTVG